MCFENRREKKLISARRSRKALLWRQELNWALKSEPIFICGIMVWHRVDIVRGNYMQKVISLGIYILGFRNRFSFSGLVCMERKTE